jgi:PAS domain-containing protein
VVGTTQHEVWVALPASGIRPPFRMSINDDLVKCIKKRLEKFRTIREEANREFNQLFNISPVGLLLFDENKIFKANQALINLLRINEDNILEIQIKA